MIKCNPISSYPSKLDELIFFQDNDLENISSIEEYNHLINQEKYDEAIRFVKENGEIYGFFAEFFNLIENRVGSLQEYLSYKYKTLKKQPFVHYTKSTYDLKVFTDTDIQETTEDLYVFSDDITFDPFELLTIFTGNQETDIIEKDEIEPPVVDKDTIWI